MVVQAIPGARYRDHVIGKDVEVAAVREKSTEDESSQIVVDLEYESGEEVTLDLDVFKSTEGFEVLEIPDEEA